MDTEIKERNYMEISRQALAHNAAAVRDYVNVPIIGVVKCNGYGVSIPEAARTWQNAGVTMFAVSTPEEALYLRQAGFREDVLLLAPVADRETLNSLLENNIILTIGSFENARFYSLHANTAPIRTHVAVDTGMGRFGVRWTDTEQLKAIYHLHGFRFEGIFSHFSKSFEKEYRQTRLQLERFLFVTGFLTRDGFQIGIRHIANSCAALRFPQTRLDAVRIGSALVGQLCAQVPIRLDPVLLLKAQVVDIKTFSPGDTTGYASVCRIRRPTRAVIVALGHEDGLGIIHTPDNLPCRDYLAWLRRLLRSRRPYVMYNGQRLPLIGRVGNQYTLFDAGEADIRPGYYVSAQGSSLFPNQHRKFI